MRIGADATFSFTLAGPATSATFGQGGVADVEAVDAQGLSIGSGSSSGSSSNMLEGNFVHSGNGQSRYVTGLIDSFRIENQFKNKMQSIVASYSSLAAQPGSYAEKNLIGRQAADAVQDLKDSEVSEKMEEKLEESREELEEKVEETMEDGEAQVVSGSVEGQDAEPIAAQVQPETMETPFVEDDDVTHIDLIV